MDTNNVDEQAKQRAEDRMAARVAALRPQRVTSIAAGEHLSMCVTDRGEVFATGDNSHGQLGLFATSFRCCCMVNYRSHTGH